MDWDDAFYDIVLIYLYYKRISKVIYEYINNMLCII